MWPWDWVIAAGNAVAGISQQVYDWVSRLIASVTSWVTNAFNVVWNAIGTLVADIASVFGSAIAFAESLLGQLWGVIQQVRQDITNWVTRIWNDVWNYARGVYDWALNELGNLERSVDALFNAVYQWVQREVFDPLKRLYDGLMSWVTGWINKIWQYIQHPELLVQLVGGFLMRTWLSYVRQFGPVLARWLIRNMRGLAGEVFDLLEHVISSVL
jgi:phage-related protein